MYVYDMASVGDGINLSYTTVLLLYDTILHDPFVLTHPAVAWSSASSF